MRRRAPRLLRALPAVALVLAGAGCGGGDTPADRVPALQTRLDAVDRAVAARDYGAARTALDRLERAAHRAERSGDLGSDDSAAIVSAADRLLSALPGRSPSSGATPTPTPTPSPEQDTQAPPAPPEPPGHDKPGKPDKHDKPPKGPKPPKPPKGHDHGHGPGEH